MGLSVRTFPFETLRSADLVVDATYEGDAAQKHMGADPLGPLTGTGNQGGFGRLGPPGPAEARLLYTSLNERDWPDAIGEENGLFVYYGDNRKPGIELHDPRAGKGGNHILRQTFELVPRAAPLVPALLPLLVHPPPWLRL